ncbi:MAG: class I SAM-dependent methyltransferase [Burkholderiales bacterium]|nr:class I SAM-dependent methyltransferase [Burkholderiales bacterium]
MRAQPHWQFDVPFVPTPHVVIEEMLRLANVTPQDFVMDLGSGDGRVLITAAQKFGARGIGVDLDGELIAESIESAQAAGVTDRVQFLQQDLFKTDLDRASVITMYLLPGVMARLQPRLLELKPGTRLVSHDFRLGDWKPDVTTQIRKNTFLWIVPARVAGRWQMKLALPGGEHAVMLELRQQYQEVDGFGRFSDRHSQIWEPRLSGDRLSFVMVDDRDRDNEAALYFEGRVSGDVIEGQLRRGTGNAQTVHPWRAQRVAAP